MLLSLFFKYKIMSSKNMEAPDKNYNEEKFEKAFEEEMWKWWEEFDKKAFGEIISWSKFDENLSKEENFKNAFNKKIDWLIDSNLKNLPPDKLAELKALQKETNNWKDSKDLIKNYKKIKETLWTRFAEVKKWETDIQNQDNQKNQEKIANKAKDFIDELLEAINENNELQKKSDEERKIKQAELAQEQAWELKIADAWIEQIESLTATA